MFVIYVGIDKYVTMWLWEKKRKRAENGGWLTFAHPSDSHHHIFTTGLFIYIKYSLNVHSSQLIMTLHNTFHGWIPRENSGPWIFSCGCEVELHGTIDGGTDLAIIPHSPCTQNGTRVCFIHTRRDGTFYAVSRVTTFL